MIRISTLARTGVVALAALSLAACHGSGNNTSSADNSAGGSDNMLTPADSGNDMATDSNMAMDNGAMAANDTDATDKAENTSNSQ